MNEVAPGDFVRVGVCEEASRANADGIANIGYVAGTQSVAVIDPGGSLLDGQRLRSAILANTSLPIRYVIMTHGHPDHVFGGGAFARDNPIYVGHWRLIAELAARADHDHARLTRILGKAATGSAVAPTLLVHDTVTLDLGNRTLELHAISAAHSDTDLTILDHGTDTLWTGDLLFVDRVPAIDGSLKGWLSALDQLRRLPATHAVPGHGPGLVAWPAGADDERRYLTLLLHDVRASISAGEDIEKAVSHDGAAERGRWALFDEYNGRNATEAYRELQWE